MQAYSTHKSSITLLKIVIVVRMVDADLPGKEEEEYRKFQALAISYYIIQYVVLMGSRSLFHIIEQSQPLSSSKKTFAPAYCCMIYSKVYSTTRGVSSFVSRSNRN
jgi:hypothetical protein